MCNFLRKLFGVFGPLHEFPFLFTHLFRLGMSNQEKVDLFAVFSIGKSVATTNGLAFAFAARTGTRSTCLTISHFEKFWRLGLCRAALPTCGAKGCLLPPATGLVTRTCT